MIGMMVAIDEEADTLIKNSTVIEIDTDKAMTFYHLAVGEQHVIMAKSGAGKVNASMAAVKMLEKYDVKYIINTGIAGGIGSLTVGSLVIGDSVVYHDVNMSSYRHTYQYGQVRGLPLEFKAHGGLVADFYGFCNDNRIMSYIGAIATGDCFISNIECLQKIMKVVPNIMAVDMESAAIAQVCYLYGIPFLPVRIVSDLITEDYIENEFTWNIREACAELGETLIEYISVKGKL